MLDALNSTLHSTSARPVAAVASANAGGRRSTGQETASGFPGLGDYGRAAQDKADTAAGGASAISATIHERTNTATNAGQDEQATGDSLHLSPEAQAQLRKLKQRDAEVRAHEKAHMAAGGQYVTGGPSYEYQQGPDGRQYAIGGHVSIDASSIPDDPEAGATKARQIRRAALAPGEPSAQDRAVAAKAAAQEARAARKDREEAGEDAAGATEGTQGTQGVEHAQGVQGAQGPQGPEATHAREGAQGTEGAATRATAPWSASGARDDHHALTRAAETYAAMAQRGVMPTALAPGGTGISLQV